MKKKVQVAMNWTLDVLFTKDLVQYLPHTAQTVSKPEPEVCEIPAPKVVEKTEKT
jgi:hypothetical protein